MTLDNDGVFSDDVLSTLLAAMLSDPQGRFSPSVYETGRMVALAPSLAGHGERVRYLLDQQRPDGMWGGPEDYALVPSLSAVEGLLTTVDWPNEGYSGAEVAAAANRGIRALASELSASTALPDTAAVEVIVPTLTDQINARLDPTDHGTDAAPGGWPLLPQHRDSCPALAQKLRDALRRGQPLPEKLQHSLETVGPDAKGAPGIRPAEGGSVGCSPAATAAWLGDDRMGEELHPSLRYLQSVQTPRTHAVPVAAPLAVFERAWVLSTLAGIGLIDDVAPELLTSLHARFTEEGVAGGLGLPPDADDTAAALHVLAKAGSPRSPECLWTYHNGTHFSCFPDERTPSTSTNAHVLQAFGASLRLDLPERQRYTDVVNELSRWLVEQQHADGSWSDKWHASPYYATVCCAVALAEYGIEASMPAVRRAVEWVLATQRADGSWGRWEPTCEETAYAVQILLRTRVPFPNGPIEEAAAKGCGFLLQAGNDSVDPPLWHDKDLYTPKRIIEVEKFAALHLARGRRRVRELIGQRRRTAVA